MAKPKYNQACEISGTAKWPVHLDRLNQQTIVLGLCFSPKGESIGYLQACLQKLAHRSRTVELVGGLTHDGDTRHGRGYIDQWFVPSWLPLGCTARKLEGYNFVYPESRIMIRAESRDAEAKLTLARKTVEEAGLVEQK